VGYALSMSAEIREWLADLTVRDPDAAIAVGQALVALADAGPDLGPPVVVALDNPDPSADPAELDYSYQNRLERLQALRRAVADVSTLSQELKAHINELQESQSTADVAELRRLLPRLDRAEQRLTSTSQYEQAEADAFRARKEMLKARFTVASTNRALAEYLAGPAPGTGQDEVAEHFLAIAQADEQLQDITAEIERELRRQSMPGGLIELRPGARFNPADRSSQADDIRIIFAIEPPGTALLISVLEGGTAVQGQHHDAVAVSTEVLRRVKAGDDPGASAVRITDSQAFLEEFCYDSADEVRAGANALAARARPSSLAHRRVTLGVTEAEVAARMGVPEERVSAIERDTEATDVHTLASYIEALGGRLRVNAEFGSEQIALR
jgi:hypothetical protein